VSSLPTLVGDYVLVCLNKLVSFNLDCLFLEGVPFTGQVFAGMPKGAFHPTFKANSYIMR